jgi:phosphoglycerol transferase
MATYRTATRAVPAQPRSAPKPPRRASAAPEVVTRPQRGDRTRRRAIDFGLVGGSATLIAAFLLRVWDRAWSLPFYRSAGVQMIGAMVETIDQHGWYLHNPDLAAPFGQQFFDFPHGGESLQLAAIKVLGIFTNSFGLIMNAYYVLGFGMLAVVTFAVLRHLRFSRAIAWAVALIYTFLPYHFAHGEAHLWRSTYYSAPIAALLMLWVLSFRTTFLRTPDAMLRSWSAIRREVRWSRVGIAAGLCVIVALTETMTVAFMLTALVTASARISLRDRSVVQLVVGLAVAALVAGVLVLALSPSLLNNFENGGNQVAGHRWVGEQEQYGLRISQMVLPSAHHRLQAARDITDTTNDAAPLSGSEDGQSLGVIGAVGLIVMLGAVLVRGVPRKSRDPVSDRDQLIRHGGVLSLILVLFGAASGFAVTLDLLGFTQVRVWNRVVVLIAFFALVTVAIGLERATRWLKSRSARAGLISGIALVVLVGFSIWDTAIPLPALGASPAVAPVKQFGAELERKLPGGASLYQLPVVRFPEAGPQHGMEDYDEYLPYLWSSGLRWSYGSMKGRPEADWQYNVNSDDPRGAVTGLTGLGFSGIVVDTAGYADGGAQVSARLTEKLGKPTVKSPGSRWKFWDLRRYASEHGLSQSELRDAARVLVGPLLDKLPASG